MPKKAVNESKTSANQTKKLAANARQRGFETALLNIYMFCIPIGADQLKPIINP